MPRLPARAYPVPRNDTCDISQQSAPKSGPRAVPPPDPHRLELERYLKAGGTVRDWYSVAATPAVRVSVPESRPALELPELSLAQKAQCLSEAVNATLMAVGRMPTSDAQERLWDARVDALYLTLCLEARERLSTMQPRPWYRT